MGYRVCGVDNQGRKWYLMDDMKEFSMYKGMEWDNESKASNVVKSMQRNKNVPSYLVNVYQTLRTEWFDSITLEKWKADLNKPKVVVTKPEPVVTPVTPAKMEFKPGSVVTWVDGAIKLLKDMTGLQSELMDKLSHTEAEIQDLLHVIELGTFNAAEGYQLAKKLQEVRRKRRHYKDDLLSLEAFMKERDADKFNETNGLIAGLDNRKYRPRTKILSEMNIKCKMGDICAK